MEDTTIDLYNFVVHYHLEILREEGLNGDRTMVPWIATFVF